MNDQDLPLEERDGHVYWTGPRNQGKPRIKTKAMGGRDRSATHVVFERYYDVSLPSRLKTKRVCSEPGCIWAEHRIIAKPFNWGAAYADLSNEVVRLAAGAIFQSKLRGGFDWHLDSLEADPGRVKELSNVLGLPRLTILAGFSELVREQLRIRKYGPKAWVQFCREDRPDEPEQEGRGAPADPPP